MDYKNEIVEVIKKYVPECKIYLFGSRARKTQHPGSDIDVAIDAGFPLSKEVISKIKEDLENSTIPFFVDVVDLQAVGAQMKNQILKDKILWST